MSATETTPHSARVFEVNKQHLQTTRVIDLDMSAPMGLNDVLLQVDKFALTANNISYGITGDTLGYWRFFPSDEPQQWGRLPVMGYAEVVKSKNDQILVGERVWGFMPMATYFGIVAGNVTQNTFSDVSPSREGLAPLYSTFDRVSVNPFYQKQNEDYDILLRGLFTTSWLVNDFMQDNDYFNAEQYLITSASSKTSIALAFCIKQTAKRPAIAVTAKANMAFVMSLGCYDKVISYEQISELNPLTPTVLVDMAGNKTTIAMIHQHFGEQLGYSCRIGATHHHNLDLNDKSSLLPGPTPSFFFAPSQLSKRFQDWGSAITMKHINMALLSYIAFCKGNIAINYINGIEKINDVYQKVLTGHTDASLGIVVIPFSDNK
ncbi:DUF2855 family protein [Shewanella sp.]|uniref:DUF2855 family protein n=1 Tax=Shewanella sp. TaxID=50422 RepID=UPI0040477524